MQDCVGNPWIGERTVHRVPRHNQCTLHKNSAIFSHRVQCCWGQAIVLFRLRCGVEYTLNRQIVDNVEMDVGIFFWPRQSYRKCETERIGFQTFAKCRNFPNHQMPHSSTFLASFHLPVFYDPLSALTLYCIFKPYISEYVNPFKFLFISSSFFYFLSFNYLFDTLNTGAYTICVLL